MKILISIDDTDDIDSRGTGDVAELVARVWTAAASRSAAA